MSGPVDESSAVAALSKDDRILDTTLELLRSRGPAAVNIEAVALASGVAKTTIYRRYEDREALLRTAIDRATITETVPTDLSTYDSLRWLLGQAHNAVENIVGRGTLAAIIVDDDPEFTSLLRGMVIARSAGLQTLLRERTAAGELRHDFDPPTVISLLLGAFVGQLIRGREPDAAWADNLLTLLWPAFAPQPETHAAPETPGNRESF